MAPAKYVKHIAVDLVIRILLLWLIFWFFFGRLFLLFAVLFGGRFFACFFLAAAAFLVYRNLLFESCAVVNGNICVLFFVAHGEIWRTNAHDFGLGVQRCFRNRKNIINIIGAHRFSWGLPFRPAYYFPPPCFWFSRHAVSSKKQSCVCSSPRMKSGKEIDFVFETERSVMARDVNELNNFKELGGGGVPLSTRVG